MARRKLGHLAGADQHHALILQRSEDLAREFDGGIADGNGADADVGLGANAFGNAECAQSSRCPAIRDGA